LEFPLGFPFYKIIRHPKLIFRAESPPNRQRAEIAETVRDSWQTAKQNSYFFKKCGFDKSSPYNLLEGHF